MRFKESGRDENVFGVSWNSVYFIIFMRLSFHFDEFKTVDIPIKINLEIDLLYSGRKGKTRNEIKRRYSFFTNLKALQSWMKRGIEKENLTS